MIVILIAAYVLIFYAIQNTPQRPRYPWWARKDKK